MRPPWRESVSSGISFGDYLLLWPLPVFSFCSFCAQIWNHLPPSHTPKSMRLFLEIYLVTQNQATVVGTSETLLWNHTARLFLSNSQFSHRKLTHMASLHCLSCRSQAQFAVWWEFQKQKLLLCLRGEKPSSRKEMGTKEFQNAKSPSSMSLEPWVVLPPHTQSLVFWLWAPLS